MLTAESVRSVLAYDAKTGILRWKVNKPRTAAGSIAGTVKPQKSGKRYRRVSFGGKKYYAHVIVWLIVYGELPSNQLDHIDGDGLNNSIGNLRLSSPRENAMNRRLNAKNRSGATGVYQTQNNTWVASIRSAGKLQRLGTFKTKDLAIQARKDAERQLGFHENHGSVRPL